MKQILLGVFLLCGLTGFSQKYALLDKKMLKPISYTNTVTLQHSYENLFAVEKDKLRSFVTELEKILKQLNDKKAIAFDYHVGSTHFKAVKISLSAEERLDVVLTTECGTSKTVMHLLDARSPNSNNAFILSTWIKYIKSNSVKRED
ncbi:hypothetical protein BH09BAC2_BH09BAC2_11260 [soil metagenome]